MLSVNPARISDKPFLTEIENILCIVGFLISASIKSVLLPICAKLTARLIELIVLPLFAVGLVTTKIGHFSPCWVNKRFVLIALYASLTAKGEFWQRIFLGSDLLKPLFSASFLLSLRLLFIILCISLHRMYVFNRFKSRNGSEYGNLKVSFKVFCVGDCRVKHFIDKESEE